MGPLIRRFSAIRASDAVVEFRNSLVLPPAPRQGDSADAMKQSEE